MEPPPQQQSQNAAPAEVPTTAEGQQPFAQQPRPVVTPLASAMLVAREAVRSGGPCPLSRHTVYLIRVRARGRQWVVRRRYRQFYALHQEVQDGRLLVGA